MWKLLATKSVNSHPILKKHQQKTKIKMDLMCALSLVVILKKQENKSH